MRQSLAIVLRSSLWLPLAFVVLSGCLSPISNVPPQEGAQDDALAAESKPDPNAIRAISYTDLDLPMEPDTLFEEWMLTQRVRDLEGKRVRLTGFMCGGVQYRARNIKQFILLREKECPFGVGGQAHHAVAISMKDTSANFTTDGLTVEGVFSVRPFTGYNDKTWSVYAIDEASIKD